VLQIQGELNMSRKQHFLHLLANGVHSHAYIIQGAAGTGKVDFALFCAAAILCESGNPPCRTCNSCKKVFSLAHPDIHFYGDEDGKPITMKEVRDLIDSSVLVPNDGEKKIYIIRAAHKMRTDTQNAILKIFEEPPASVVIFLLTEKKEALLPTILSRGQLIVLPGESDEFIESRLRKKFKTANDSEIAAAVRASDGSLGQAESFLGKENRDTVEKATLLLDTLFNGSKTEFYNKLISAKITREKLIELLGLFQRLLADIIEYKYGKEVPVLLSCEEAGTYAESVTKKALLQMSEAVADCRNSLEQSGNMNAAVTNLCSKLWKQKF
jgi:DNA polymerase-3 subunit delta'